MTRTLALLLLLTLPAWAQGTIDFLPEPTEPMIEGPAAPPEAPPRAFPLEFLPEPQAVALDAPAAPPQTPPAAIPLNFLPEPQAVSLGAPAPLPTNPPAPTRLTQIPEPITQAAAAEIPGLPDPPGAAPPPPPQFSPRPAPAPTRAPSPQIPLPAGLEALPNGGLRIRGATLDAATRAALADYGRRLQALPRGRVTIYAEVAGPAEDAHTARRLSLAHAQAAKDALVEGGLDATRIDLRPLGRTTAGMDRLDVLPPGVDRSEQPR